MKTEEEVQKRIDMIKELIESKEDLLKEIYIPRLKLKQMDVTLEILEWVIK